jgi:hypothetical protein
MVNKKQVLLGHKLSDKKSFQTLFFLYDAAHIRLGGRVTVTDGDRMLITIMNISLHNSVYQL